MSDHRKTSGPPDSLLSEDEKRHQCLVDRRSGFDRRRAYSLAYFANGGLERRQERRRALAVIDEVAERAGLSERCRKKIDKARREGDIGQALPGGMVRADHGAHLGPAVVGGHSLLRRGEDLGGLGFISIGTE